MKQIVPTFRDENDKLASVAVILLSMFFFFIPSLIVVLFCKKYVGESSYEISKMFFNYELFLFLISLVCIIPIIGWLVGLFLIPILYIWNVIVVVMALCAVGKGSEVKVPVPYEFV